MNHFLPSALLTMGIPQLAFSICESLFTHFLPIFIVLRVYNVEDRPEEIARSLIASGDSEPTGDD